MRAAMMELDCFITRKKEVEDPTVASSRLPQKRRPNRSLREAVKGNSESGEIKGRMYLTVCCSVLGMCVFTVLMVVAGAFIMMQLH